MSTGSNSVSLRTDDDERASLVRSVVPDARVNILMYHSISHAPGPTSIAPETFRGQMDILAACGYHPISLSAFASWHAGDAELSPRSVVITFDDGFADFAEHAFPKLQARNWTATVFLPSGKIGQSEDWDGSNSSTPRRLLSWGQVADLAKEDIEFGGHSVTHRDLTKLSSEMLRHELRHCRDQIEQRLERAPVNFAPPYGRTNQRVRDEIRRWYRVSVGTKLQRADPQCDLYDVPRIEMHYFRDLRRWRAYLEGRADWYFESRRALRGVKQLATQSWRR